MILYSFGNILNFALSFTRRDVEKKQQRMSYGFHSKNFIPENFVKILLVVIELLMKKVQLVSCSKLGPDILMTLSQSLLNYIRKSVSLRKFCSEHKIYLCFRSTYFHNFKTIA